MEHFLLVLPGIVKTLSPLFLILLFFIWRIQFPVSWRTIERCHVTEMSRCLHVNTDTGKQHLELFRIHFGVFFYRISLVYLIASSGGEIKQNKDTLQS